MVSAEWPCSKAITTVSRETPSEPPRSVPWEFSSTYLSDEIMQSSEPSFTDDAADPKTILAPLTILGSAERGQSGATMGFQFKAMSPSLRTKDRSSVISDATIGTQVDTTSSG